MSMERKLTPEPNVLPHWWLHYYKLKYSYDFCMLYNARDTGHVRLNFGRTVAYIITAHLEHLHFLILRSLSMNILLSIIASIIK